MKLNSLYKMENVKGRGNGPYWITVDLDQPYKTIFKVCHIDGGVVTKTNAKNLPTWTTSKADVALVSVVLSKISNE